MCEDEYQGMTSVVPQNQHEWAFSPYDREFVVQN
jgi:hypothetical protein